MKKIDWFNNPPQLFLFSIMTTPLAILLSFLLGLAGATHAAGETVGLLVVGPPESEQEQALVNRINDETHHQFTLTTRVLSDTANEAEFTKAIHELESDPKISLIVALDPISAAELRKHGSHQSKILTPFTMREMAAQIESEIRRFKALVPAADSVLILADAPALRHLKGLGANLTKSMSLLKVKIRLGSEPDQLAKGEAVYFSRFFQARLAESLVATLTKGLTPTFSGQGADLVRRGALAGLAEGPDEPQNARLAREIVRAIQTRLSGAASGEPVSGNSASARLAVNVTTARRLGLNPSLALLREAEVFGEGQGTGSELEGQALNEHTTGSTAHEATPQTLREAVLEALSNNTDLAASRFERDAQYEKQGEARAELLPKVDAGVSYLKIDSNLHEASFGAIPDQSTAGILTARQVIFSEGAWAKLAVEQDKTEASKHNTERVQLDTVNSTIKSYLNVLLARDQLDLRQDDWERTGANLRSAEARFTAGRTNRADVYRWQSQMDLAEKNLFDAKMILKSAEVALNRLLHRPLTSSVAIGKLDLDYKDVWIGNAEFRQQFTRLNEFSRLETILVQRSHDNSPEIKTLQAQEDAAQRALSSYHRKFYLPDIFAQGLVAHSFESDSTNPGSTFNTAELPIPLSLPSIDSTQWAVSLNLKYNLFSGGSDVAKVREESEKVHQLEKQKAAVVEEMEQAVRQGLFRARAAYLAIELERRSADSANKSYELMRQAYVQGAKSVTELIDAQNSAFSMNVAKASAVYTFYESYFDVLRALGTYDLLQTDEERKEYVRSLIAETQRPQ